MAAGWGGAVETDIGTVEPVPVLWLHKGYIPLGHVTVLDGDPAVGKSTVTLDYAARVSRGATMPDDTPSDLSGPAGVVLLTCEDDVASTVRPRLDAAGADLSPGRITAITGITDRTGTSQLPTLEHLTAIEDVMVAHGAKLLIVDPLMAYLPSRVDSHRDQDVRRVLAKLKALAERTGAAILVVRHLNKATPERGQQIKAMYRGAASIAIVALVRSGLLIAADPNDRARRILAVVKANLVEEPPSLAYRIEKVGMSTRVQWLGPADLTADDLVNPYGPPRNLLQDAETFLSARLFAGGESVAVLEAEGAKLGLTPSTLRRAKDTLGVRSTKRGLQDGWNWELPPERRPGGGNGA